jgi:hypothetical protein
VEAWKPVHRKLIHKLYIYIQKLQLIFSLQINIFLIPAAVLAPSHQGEVQKRSSIYCTRQPTPGEGEEFEASPSERKETRREDVREGQEGEENKHERHQTATGGNGQHHSTAPGGIFRNYFHEYSFTNIFELYIVPFYVLYFVFSDLSLFVCVIFHFPVINVWFISMYEWPHIFPRILCFSAAVSHS